MAVQPNGTDAKDVVLHFLKWKDWRVTPTHMVQGIPRVKSLLKAGFTKDEIISVIDYVMDKKGPTNVYSIGYFNSCINETLDKIKAEQQVAVAKEEKNKNIDLPKEDFNASTSNNRTKAERLGNKSSFGTKSFSDMFKE